MNEIDDTTLIAYVDGELDPTTTEEVEAELERSPELRRVVSELRESTALVRAAYNHVMYEPLPALPRPSLDEAGARRLGASGSGWGMLLAASLAALVIGGVSGHLSTRYTIESELGRAQLARATQEAAVQQVFMRALEKSLSGTTVSWRDPDGQDRLEVTPVRTFRVKSGQFCRQFERTQVVQGVARSDQGIACREAGGYWRTRMQFFDG